MTEAEARIALGFPYDDPMRMQMTVQGILIIAAGGVEDTNVKDWIRTDRYGTWEKTAMDLLLALPARVVNEVVVNGAPIERFTRATAISYIALEIAAQAIEAMIRYRLKNGAVLDA